jgi:lipid II:glycine glycyltransferase (peptidoglycan interpeptide bridge formation enzyme)
MSHGGFATSRGPVSSRVEVAPVDSTPAWDAFVGAVAPGHFDQLSAWARAKALQGWRARRLILEDGAGIAAGSQVLVRQKGRWMPRIGFVPRGPLTRPGDDALVPAVIDALERMVSDERIDALVLQPSEHGHAIAAECSRRGYLPNHLVRVVGANLIIDLRGGFEAVSAAMRPHLRQEARQAARRGIAMRLGRTEDLPAFFDLMLATCRRQGAAPNPSRLAYLREIWDAFGPGTGSHLLMAEQSGTALAGVVALACGRRLTLWKKGSTDDATRSHANPLLFCEAIRWAAGAGYESCDFAGMGRDVAEEVLGGSPLSDAARASRDFFSLGLGGQPVLYPPSLVLVPRLWLKLGYRMAIAGAARSGRLRRLATRLADRSARR